MILKVVNQKNVVIGDNLLLHIKVNTFFLQQVFKVVKSYVT